MKSRAAVWLAMMLSFSGFTALCESNTSEIEKIAGVASWLLGEVKEYQLEKKEQQRAFDAMLWMYDDENPVSPDDVPEIAARLKALGIDGITDAHIGRAASAAKDAQTYGYIYSRGMAVLSLLSAVGMGVYDNDFVWHPSSDMVFCLDMELFGSEGLYGDFFEGLNAVCRGEFVFSDFAEDYAQADLAEGVGIIGLSFLVNGVPHTVDAMLMQDWFDAEVFNAAAEIAVHEESGRRLYALYDGLQGLVIFYNTPEWAQRFEAETGCPLLEALPFFE